MLGYLIAGGIGFVVGVVAVFVAGIISVCRFENSNKTPKD